MKIKTFESFLDFFKAPVAPVQSMSEDRLRFKIQRIMQPLSTDGEFLMHVVANDVFHVNGVIGNIAYSAGILKVPFFAGKHEAPLIKAAINNNIKAFEYFTNNENPAPERVVADSFVKEKVEAVLTIALQDRDLMAWINESGRVTTNGLVELGFKYTLVLENIGSSDSVLSKNA